MVKKKGTKRKIQIEDKRVRNDDEVSKKPEPGADKKAQEAAELLNEQLREFTEGGEGVDVASVLNQGTAQDAYVQAGGDVPAGSDNDWQQKAAEYLELAQRREAEMRNLRKRIIDEKADARRFAIEGLLYDLFPALDGLSQAAHTFKDKPAGEDPLLDGVRGTVKVMTSALMSHGIEKIAEADVPFDMNLHQALSVEESDDVTEQMIAEVYVEGYRLGDRVLKPAMVKVLKPMNCEDAG